MSRRTVRNIIPDCRDDEGRIVVPLHCGLTVSMPDECIIDLSAPGRVDADCEYWAESDRIDWGVVKFSDIVRELREYGAWSAEELQECDHMNRQRLLWVLAGWVADDEDMFPRVGGAL